MSESAPVRPDDDGASAGKRRYRSPRRQMQAEQTRAAVIAAASRVFSQRGWMGTNVRDVAREAGVSGETLYSGFGSKGRLLKGALGVAIRGDAQPVPFSGRAQGTARTRGATRAAA